MTIANLYSLDRRLHLEHAVDSAIRQFVKRHGTRPTVALMHPDDRGNLQQVDGVTVQPDSTQLKGSYMLMSLDSQGDVD